MPGIRIDRALTTAVFHPLRRALGQGGLRLPVLMYHRICDDPEDGVAPYYRVNTSPSVFRQHLRQLASEGYQTMGLAKLAGMLSRQEPLAPKTVVITFDDGFRDFHTEAFPALREFHFSATVFLPTAFIQGERRCFKGTECLTWDEVRELRQAGIEFGSHSVNHPKLVELGWPEIERELRDSKDQLEQQLAEKVTTFAYPYAFPQGDQDFAGAFRSLLVRAGYTCCATTEIGRVKAGMTPFVCGGCPPTAWTMRSFSGRNWPEPMIGWPGRRPHSRNSRRNRRPPANGMILPPIFSTLLRRSIFA